MKLWWSWPLLLLLTGCDRGADTQDQTQSLNVPPTQQQSALSVSSAFRADLGLSAYTHWSQASQLAQVLDTRIAALLHEPDEQSLAQTRLAWRQAYDAYLQALLFSYLPITDPSEWRRQGLDQMTLLERLDSWPIEPGYIDYLPGYPFSGIVNDLALDLNGQTLLDQHGFSDPTSASIGYHPIEFMLWGNDGTRTARDFLPRENTAAVLLPAQDQLQANDDISVQNHHRRREYLQLVSEQLQKDLQRIQRRWQPSEGYYAESLQRANPEQALQALLIAMQRLTSQQLLQRRLEQHSSEFSVTSLDDLQALSDGVFAMLTATDTSGSGLTTVLQASQLSQWQQLQQDIELTLQQWRSGQLLTDDARQQLREDYITLLSYLQTLADQYQLQLPMPH